MAAEDYEMLAEFEEEQSRKGNFELIFPTPDTIQSYGNCFQHPRSANAILWQYLTQREQGFKSLKQAFATNQLLISHQMAL